MSYREPSPPFVRPPSPELDDYEQRLRKGAKRKKMVFGAVVGLMGIVGMGSCLGPCAIEITGDAWRHRKNKLTKDEAKKASGILDAIEAQSKTSQTAFEAVWPKLREGELGARSDLGRCRVRVPGPSIQKKGESTSLEDSSQGAGWTFIDLTPASPLGALKMPEGSILLNNNNSGDRFVMRGKPLRLVPRDKPPILDSTTNALRVVDWRKEASEPMQHDAHASFLRRLQEFAADLLDVDVVVFVDVWEDPKFSDEPPPAPKDDLEEFTRKGARPTHMFDSGLAIARAFAWDPKAAEIACASQALAESSEGIRFTSKDPAPLQQDLVLQLERSLQRSFVAVGDAPPKVTRPVALPPPEPEPAPTHAPKKKGPKH